MRQYIYSEILAAIRPESFLFAMYTMQKFYHSYIPVFSLILFYLKEINLHVSQAAFFLLRLHVNC